MTPPPESCIFSRPGPAHGWRQTVRRRDRGHQHGDRRRSNRARSMTATSGGGFSLMTEAVGLAGMLETPVVIANVQRGGPSTGLPTKNGTRRPLSGSGRQPGRVSPHHFGPELGCGRFFDHRRGFNLADKYQCPVLLLSDLLLSEHMETVETLDLNVRVDRGEIVTKDGGRLSAVSRHAERHLAARPARTPGTLYVSPSDEHNEKARSFRTWPPIRRCGRR